MLSRRQLLLAFSALAGTAGRARAQVHAKVEPGPAGADVSFPAVVPRPLRFPQDFGAHPAFRSEWWYLTGWLGDPSAPLGFQITFFRSRTDIDPANPSAFAAKQLIIAHAALADPARGALSYDQRIARAGFGVAGAAEGDTDVRLGDWQLAREPTTGTYNTTVKARGFTLALAAVPARAPLLQGEGGYSRKGPLPAQASYYYSRPQLAVRATVERDGERRTLTGIGWLDHEWSSSLLADGAAGWDWVGMNLADGGALTAFQIRRQNPQPGDRPIWAYASLGRRDGAMQTYAPAEVRFEPISRWASPRTRVRWPVAQRLRIGDRTFETRPLLPDQELDSTASTGAVYWEGASTLLEHGRETGRGYLEMTGYVRPLQL